MKNVRANSRFWIAGMATAFLGVALARVMAAHFDGLARLILTGGGQLLALSGLFIICLGVRRRVQSAPFTDAPQDSTTV